MNKKTLLWLGVAALLLIAGAMQLGRGSNVSGGGDDRPPLAGAAIGGPFALIDEDGQPFDSQRLKGRYTLIYFGYTYCPDVCPVDLQRLMQGLKQFEARSPERAARVQPVFITVDPERDTPAIVKQFTSAFHPRLIGLTGDRPAIDAALKAYRIYARKVGPADSKDYLIDHSANGFLFDPDGNAMVLFASDDSPEAVAASLDRWVK